MPKKFVPNGDLDFATMADCFARAIAQDPARFEIAQSDADELSESVGRFKAALQACRGGGRSQMATAPRRMRASKRRRSSAGWATTSATTRASMRRRRSPWEFTRSLGGRKPVPVLEDAGAQGPAGRAAKYTVEVLDVLYQTLRPHEIAVEPVGALPAPVKREVREIEGPAEQSEAA